MQRSGVKSIKFIRIKSLCDKKALNTNKKRIDYLGEKQNFNLTSFMKIIPGRFMNEK